MMQLLLQTLLSGKSDGATQEQRVAGENGEGNPSEFFDLLVSDPNVTESTIAVLGDAESQEPSGIGAEVIDITPALDESPEPRIENLSRTELPLGSGQGTVGDAEPEAQQTKPLPELGLVAFLPGSDETADTPIDPRERRIVLDRPAAEVRQSFQTATEAGVSESVPPLVARPPAPDGQITEPLGSPVETPETSQPVLTDAEPAKDPVPGPYTVTGDRPRAAELQDRADALQRPTPEIKAGQSDLAKTSSTDYQAETPPETQEKTQPLVATEVRPNPSKQAQSIVPQQAAPALAPVADDSSRKGDARNPGRVSAEFDYALPANSRATPATPQAPLPPAAVVPTAPSLPFTAVPTRDVPVGFLDHASDVALSNLENRIEASSTDRPRPEPAAARAIVNQVIQSVLRAPGEGVIEIRLQPEELGRVRLSMSPIESGVSVQIIAERGETLDLLRRNIDLLEGDLLDQGFDNLEFAFGSEGFGDDGTPSGPDGDETTAFESQADRSLQVNVLPVTETTVSNRLDIRV